MQFNLSCVQLLMQSREIQVASAFQFRTCAKQELVALKGHGLSRAIGATRSTSASAAEGNLPIIRQTAEKFVALE